MKFFTQILRITLIFSAIATTVLFSMAGFTGVIYTWGADPSLNEGIFEEFRREPIWYRSCMAGLGCMVGVVVSALAVGPIALLFEIRDNLAVVGDRLSAMDKR
jgi:hypothetical protein